MTEAIIFDCFGVLYTDSKWSLRTVVAPERAEELNDVFLRNDYGHTTREEYLASISEITGLTVTEVEDYIAHEHRLNKELTGYIKRELKPHYKIGLLSNIGRGWIDDFFSKHDLHDLFDEVVLSGEEGIAKPHPAIFTTMAERLGVHPGDCIMIDDISENCGGARAAGMAAIDYHSNDQLVRDLSTELQR